MEKIKIEATSSTPGVILDPEKKVFEISGESRPKNVPEFYGPILQWLEDFEGELVRGKDDHSGFTLHLKFEYFNSLSGKFILDICKKLSRMRSEGYAVSITWHYEEDDEDMHEVGREMSRIAKIPFAFVATRI